VIMSLIKRLPFLRRSEGHARSASGPEPAANGHGTTTPKPQSLSSKSPGIHELIRLKEEAGEFDVFLCHNGADKQVVRWTAECLRKRGIRPWLDEAELPPGRSWQEELEQQIEHIKTVAVFVGPNGLGPWQNWEMRAFLSEFTQRRCPVIPVLLPGAAESDLPVFLKRLTWVDLRGQDETGIDLLVWGITGQRPGQLWAASAWLPGAGPAGPGHCLADHGTERVHVGLGGGVAQ